MGQNEAKVRQRPEDAPVASDGSFSSLSKTLEDLEQRLSRLSSTKTAAAAPTEEPAETATTRSAGEKLRIAAEARRARRPS